ncbi:MAG: dihydrofolate reductase family protein [Gammaproteobacteria bacterium]|nr:dihydrofolate reductase family protein [Gammaproteobacteria bacterium]
MRKLKYYVACTLDGFIAHPDGSLDGFPWDDEVVADFFDSHKLFDIVLMGRKTYEVGLKEGKTNPYPTMRQYVFSRSMEESPDENVTLISENALELVRELKQETGKDIWLCGGADLAGTLFADNLIDELTIKLNPVLFGTGIPLFSGAIKQTALELIDTKIYQCGTVFLHYRL